MNVVINKIPKELWIKNKVINFDIFIEKLTDYMEDLEDKQKVKAEMNNEKDEVFDYSLIRSNYV